MMSRPCWGDAGASEWSPYVALNMVWSRAGWTKAILSNENIYFKLVELSKQRKKQHNTTITQQSNAIISQQKPHNINTCHRNNNIMVWMQDWSGLTWPRNGNLFFSCSKVSTFSVLCSFPQNLLRMERIVFSHSSNSMDRERMSVHVCCAPLEFIQFFFLSFAFFWIIIRLIDGIIDEANMNMEAIETVEYRRNFLFIKANVILMFHSSDDEMLRKCMRS